MHGFVLFRAEQYSRKCKILPTESICVSRAEGFNIIELFAFLLCAVCSVNAYIILCIFYSVSTMFYNVSTMFAQCSVNAYIILHILQCFPQLLFLLYLFSLIISVLQKSFECAFPLTGLCIEQCVHSHSSNEMKRKSFLTNSSKADLTMPNNLTISQYLK